MSQPDQAPTDGSPPDTRPSSRIPGFYRMPLEERLALLKRRGVLDDDDVALLRDRRGGLTPELANRMIENTIGVLELPLGLGLNFIVNDLDYLVPMAVEEPSILAAVSHVARLVRDCGGFRAESTGSTMIGQIQVVGCPDFEAARAAVLEARDHLVDAANRFEPNMVARGGGARDVEVRLIDQGRYPRMLVVHLIVDTCDAMGANMINTMVEGIAELVEELTGGQVFLRILSNLCDKRLVRASCRIPFERLSWRGFDGQKVARGIELASQFAEVDPYRATTHNKGIMNGISAVCLATGNDWRALEAGAHAYAARHGQYGPLAVWRCEDDALVGEIEVPIQVGTVGGPIRLHPTVQLAHKILGVEGASELGCVMGAVGLAQNMAALKALATEGIQRGHMSLHARAVAATAGAGAHEIDAVVERLVACGDVKVHRAEEILDELRTR